MMFTMLNCMSNMFINPRIHIQPTAKGTKVMSAISTRPKENSRNTNTTNPHIYSTLLKSSESDSTIRFIKELLSKTYILSVSNNFATACSSSLP